MLGEGKGEQWKPEASWAQIKLPPINRETTMTRKRICHYIHLFSPLAYLQTFISAYFSEALFCFFLLSFFEVRTAQGLFHSKMYI